LEQESQKILDTGLSRHDYIGFFLDHRLNSTARTRDADTRLAAFSSQIGIETNAKPDNWLKR
jgi:hypothetical protein